MNDESEVQVPNADQDSKPRVTATLRVWHLLVLGTLISAFGFPLILVMLLPLAIATTLLEQPK